MGKKEETSEDKNQFNYHRFLDEAGDTAFFGKGKIPIIGNEGVSKTFIIGMVKFKQPLDAIRKQVVNLQKSIADDPYYREVPSIQKKIRQGGFYFHAHADPPEAKKAFFDFINYLDCSFEAVVGRKIPLIFERKHHEKEAEFYADLLGHLLKNKLCIGDKLVLNIAARGASTRNAVLQMALDKATHRFSTSHPGKKVETKVVFNIQNHATEPLLNVADYFCWALQRVFERGETRYYDFLREKISLVVDLYDSDKWEGSNNYYTPKRPLTAENKISPPLH